MEITTKTCNRVKVLAANSTNDSALSALAETLTKPSGAGIFNVAGMSQILVWPFGSDATNEAFDIEVSGWWRSNVSWGSSVLFRATCTLGATTGAASCDITNTDYPADTITRTAGVAGYVLEATTAETSAAALIDTLGVSLIQIRFDVNTAASANAMIALI